MPRLSVEQPLASPTTLNLILTAEQVAYLKALARRINARSYSAAMRAVLNDHMAREAREARRTRKNGHTSKAG